MTILVETGNDLGLFIIHWRDVGPEMELHRDQGGPWPLPALSTKSASRQCFIVWSLNTLLKFSHERFRWCNYREGHQWFSLNSWVLLVKNKNKFHCNIMGEIHELRFHYAATLCGSVYSQHNSFGFVSAHM